MSLRVDQHEPLGDWWTITDDGAWISDACVEGTAEEMHEIARALRCGGSYFAHRCAVSWSNGHAEFHSPRNSSGGISQRFAQVEAMALAEQIEREVKP